MKRRWSGMQVARVAPLQSGVPSSIRVVSATIDDSSAEVTSSSTLVMSPANSLASTDIGDVDLEFWDLDLNHQNQARNLIIQSGYGLNGHAVITTVAKSDTSSMSGTTCHSKSRFKKNNSEKKISHLKLMTENCD